jgi:hypothetical protein
MGALAPIVSTSHDNGGGTGPPVGPRVVPTTVGVVVLPKIFRQLRPLSCIDRTADQHGNPIIGSIPRQCFEFRVGCQLFWLSAADPRLSGFLSFRILGAKLTSDRQQLEKQISQRCLFSTAYLVR